MDDTLREMLEAAKPGPWQLWEGGCDLARIGYGDPHEGHRIGGWMDIEDARLIVELHNRAWETLLDAPPRRQ